jgi:DNA-binding MarR family transcriptional regulator
MKPPPTVEPTSEVGSPFEDSILRSLRRITRAIDLHSRQLIEQIGLTGPQVLCLRLLVQHQTMMPTELAKEMSLSPATITGIIDRLEARGLLSRDRSQEDRRTVKLAVTPAGREAIKSVPSVLQECFAQRLRELPPENQRAIHLVLEQIVRMMDVEVIEAAPEPTAAGGLEKRPPRS